MVKLNDHRAIRALDAEHLILALQVHNTQVPVWAIKPDLQEEPFTTAVPRHGVPLATISEDALYFGDVN